MVERQAPQSDPGKDEEEQSDKRQWNFSVEHFLTKFRAPIPHDKERHEECV